MTVTSDQWGTSRQCPWPNIIYFINDLPNVTNLTTIFFEDDTKVYTSITSYIDRDKLQEAIDNMYSWTQTWLLKFNENKCKVLPKKKK